MNESDFGMNIPSLPARRPDRKNSIGSVTVSLLLHALIFLGMMHTSEASRSQDQLLVVNLAFLSAGGSGSGSREGGGQGGAATSLDEPESSSPASFQSEPLPEPVPAAPPEPKPEQDSLAPVTADSDAVPVVRPDAEKKRAETKPKTRRKPETAKKEPVKPEERKPEAIERQENFPTAREEGSGNALAGAPRPGKEAAPSGTGGGKSGGDGGAASGAGGSAKGYIKANFAYIQRHILQHLEYPPQARMMFQSGVAHYSFVVEKSGKVSSLRLTKSSGFPLLDKAGEKAISAASPLPAPPEPARIAMPIRFTLK